MRDWGLIILIELLCNINVLYRLKEFDTQLYQIPFINWLISRFRLLYSFNVLFLLVNINWMQAGRIGTGFDYRSNQIYAVVQ